MNTIELKKDNEMPLFKNIMIIDNIFKANGNIYAACLNLYEKDVDEEDIDDDSVCLYGLDIDVDVNDDFPVMFSNSDFRFVFDSDTVLFIYGSVSVRLEQPCNDKDIEDFKKTILCLLNLRYGNSCETLDQFIDLYNMIHI